MNNFKIDSYKSAQEISKEKIGVNESKEGILYRSMILLIDKKLYEEAIMKAITYNIDNNFVAKDFAIYESVTRFGNKKKTTINDYKMLSEKALKASEVFNNNVLEEFINFYNYRLDNLKSIIAESITFID